MTNSANELESALEAVEAALEANAEADTIQAAPPADDRVGTWSVFAAVDQDMSLDDTTTNPPDDMEAPNDTSETLLDEDDTELDTDGMLLAQQSHQDENEAPSVALADRLAPPPPPPPLVALELDAAVEAQQESELVIQEEAEREAIIRSEPNDEQITFPEETIPEPAPVAVETNQEDQEKIQEPTNSSQQIVAEAVKDNKHKAAPIKTAERSARPVVKPKSPSKDDFQEFQRIFVEGSNAYQSRLDDLILYQASKIQREQEILHQRRRALSISAASLPPNPALTVWDVISKHNVGLDVKRFFNDYLTEQEAKHPQLTRAQCQQALVQARNANGDTLLHLAVWSGSLAKTKLVVSLGADVNLVDNTISRWTPLHEAARAGHVHLVTFLLSAGASIYSVDPGGDTPLHWACRGGHTTVVKVLLHANAPAFDTLDALNRKKKRPSQLVKTPETLRQFLQDLQDDTTMRNRIKGV
ncbi:ankyrin repeat domain [Aphanomyces cochlioides]|nr:ankyrin repeat domain [Aphanomyces cochlioides]